MVSKNYQQMLLDEYDNDYGALSAGTVKTNSTPKPADTKKSQQSGSWTDPLGELMKGLQVGGANVLTSGMGAKQALDQAQLQEIIPFVANKPGFLNPVTAGLGFMGAANQAGNYIAEKFNPNYRQDFEAQKQAIQSFAQKPELQPKEQWHGIQSMFNPNVVGYSVGNAIPSIGSVLLSGVAAPVTAATQIAGSGYNEALEHDKQRELNRSEENIQNIAKLSGISPDIIRQQLEENNQPLDLKTAARGNLAIGALSGPLDALILNKILGAGAIPAKTKMGILKNLGLAAVTGTASEAMQEGYIEQTGSNMVTNLAGGNKDLMEGVPQAIQGTLTSMPLISSLLHLPHAANNYNNLGALNQQEVNNQNIPPQQQPAGSALVQQPGSNIMDTRLQQPASRTQAWVESSEPQMAMTGQTIPQLTGPTQQAALPAPRKALSTGLIQEKESLLKQDMQAANQIRQALSTGIDALGNPLTPQAKQSYQAALEVFNQRISQNMSILDRVADDVVKDYVEELVHSQTITPDMTPSFAEPTRAEQQLMYEEMAKQGWGNITPNKEQVEQMVQQRTINPEYRPSFPQVTNAEKQLMYEELFRQNPNLTKTEIEQMVQQQLVQPQSGTIFEDYVPEAETRANQQDLYNQLFLNEQGLEEDLKVVQNEKEKLYNKQAKFTKRQPGYKRHQKMIDRLTEQEDEILGQLENIRQQKNAAQQQQQEQQQPVNEPAQEKPQDKTENPAIKRVQDKIKGKLKVKLEKREEELTEKAVNEGLTPEEQQELINNASVLDELGTQEQKQIETTEDNQSLTPEQADYRETLFDIVSKATGYPKEYLKGRLDPKKGKTDKNLLKNQREIIQRKVEDSEDKVSDELLDKWVKYFRATERSELNSGIDLAKKALKAINDAVDKGSFDFTIKDDRNTPEYAVVNDIMNNTQKELIDRYSEASEYISNVDVNTDSNEFIISKLFKELNNGEYPSKQRLDDKKYNETETRTRSSEKIGQTEDGNIKQESRATGRDSLVSGNEQQRALEGFEEASERSVKAEKQKVTDKELKEKFSSTSNAKQPAMFNTEQSNDNQQQPVDTSNVRNQQEEQDSTAEAEQAQDEQEKTFASEEDFNYKLAESAYNGTSFYTEKRAKSSIKEFTSHLNNVYNELSKFAVAEEQKQILEQEMQRYKQNFIDKVNALWSARSRTLSSMITGPSKFPTRSNQKKLDTADRRANELYEFDDKAQKAIKKKILNARNEDQKFNDEWRGLKKDISISIAYIKNIDEGNAKGYYRNSFVSSMTAKIKRLYDNGKYNLVNKALEYIQEANEKSSKPIITKRNSIWQLMYKEPDQQQVKTGEEIVGEFEGGNITNNFDDQRIRINFDEKPSPDVISQLKKNAFKWSPTNKAWQRQNTKAGLWAAEKVVKDNFNNYKEVSSEQEESVVKLEINEETEKSYDEIYKEQEEKLLEIAKEAKKKDPEKPNEQFIIDARKAGLDLFFDKLSNMKTDNWSKELIDKLKTIFTIDEFNRTAKSGEKINPSIFTSKRRGSMYVGPVDWSGIRGRVIASFSALNKAVDWLKNSGLNPLNYNIGSNNGKFHVFKKKKTIDIKVKVTNKNEVQGDDYVLGTGFIRRVRPIMEKNKYTKNIYMRARKLERLFNNKVLEHSKLIKDLEISNIKDLDKLIDIFEGKKSVSQLTEKGKKAYEDMKAAIEKQRVRVIDELVDGGYTRYKTIDDLGKISKSLELQIKTLKSKLEIDESNLKTKQNLQEEIKDLEEQNKYLAEQVQLAQSKSSGGNLIFAPDGTFINESYRAADSKQLLKDHMVATWKIENYFPHIFQGKYRVIAKRKDGSQAFVGRATTIKEAEECLKQYMEAYPDEAGDFTGDTELDVTEKPIEPNDYVIVGMPDLSKITDALSDEESGYEMTNDEIKDFMKMFVPEKEFRKARKPGSTFKREGYQGYMRDPVKALTIHFLNTEKFIQTSQFLRDASSNLAKAKNEGIQTKQKNVYNYAVNYVKAMANQDQRDFLDKGIESIVKAIATVTGNKNKIDYYNYHRNAFKKIRTYEYYSKLGFFRPDNLIIQPSLIATIIMPDIIYSHGKDGIKHLSRSMQLATSLITDKKYRDLIKESGVIDQTVIDTAENNVNAEGLENFKKQIELISETIKNGKGDKALKEMAMFFLNSSMLPFSIGDKAGRLLAFNSKLLDIMDENNIKDISNIPQELREHIIEEATLYSDEVNFSYSKANAPAMFRSETVKTALQFKQFPLFYLFKTVGDSLVTPLYKGIRNFQEGNIRAAKNEFKKAGLFPIMSLAAYAYFGVGAVPLAKELFALLSTVIGENLEVWFKQNVPGAKYGLLFSPLGIDISRSGAVGFAESFIPFDDRGNINTKWLSPSGGSISNLFDFSEGVADTLRGGSDLSIADHVETLAKREFPAAKRFFEGKYGFRTTEQGDENFVKYNVRPEKTRFIQRAALAFLRGDIKSYKNYAGKIIDSGYYTKDLEVKERAGKYFVVKKGYAPTGRAYNSQAEAQNELKKINTEKFVTAMKSKLTTDKNKYLDDAIEAIDNGNKREASMIKRRAINAGYFKDTDQFNRAYKKRYFKKASSY